MNEFRYSTPFHARSCYKRFPQLTESWPDRIQYPEIKALENTVQMQQTCLKPKFLICTLPEMFAQ